MEYLLKASSITAIFYVIYHFILQKETFFESNRFFLLSGLVCTILIPLVVIPVYVETSSQSFEGIVVANNSTNINTNATSINWLQILSYAYAIGVFFFLIKFYIEVASLYSLFKKHSIINSDNFKIVETQKNIGPFSFFNKIVYNPAHFNASELKLVVKHEQAHAKQWHSLDLMLVKLATIVFWFNPFIWLYKSALQQNLEFAADDQVQQQESNQKHYQTLLLKTSISSQQLALTNNFYNSLIKKRIVMLQSKKSNSLNIWKYSLILPILTAFVFTFNTKTLAQTTPKKANPQTEEIVKIGQNILKFIITKDTKDNQLDIIKDKLADNDVTIAFSDLKRNSDNEITGIKIEYKSKISTGNHFLNSTVPISSIEIGYNTNERNLTVGNVKSSLSHTFEVITSDGKTMLQQSDNDDQVYVVSSNDDNTQVKTETIFINKDGDKQQIKTAKKIIFINDSDNENNDEKHEVVIVKKINKNKDSNDSIQINVDINKVMWNDKDGKEIEIIDLDKGNKKIEIISDSGTDLLCYLDGKKISLTEMKALDAEKILSINVYKSKEAIKKYGKKAKDGVIEITTKKEK